MAQTKIMSHEPISPKLPPGALKGSMDALMRSSMKKAKKDSKKEDKESLAFAIDGLGRNLLRIAELRRSIDAQN